MNSGGSDHRAHMDGIYRYQRYIYDLTRKYYLLGRDRLLADLEPPDGGTILEIGCGTGRNLVLAARRDYAGFSGAVSTRSAQEEVDEEVRDLKARSSQAETR